jgi:ABC-type sugar transport system substrate-binding protein
MNAEFENCCRTWASRLVIAMSTIVGMVGLNVAFAAPAAEKLSVLIVDGQNNHGNWPQTTQMMKAHLEASGRFTVDVVTHAPKGED